MVSYPSWSEWHKDRETRLPFVFEGKAQQPNYSFDNWLKVTQNFGDEISSFVTDAKEKDQELDAEVKKAKQKKPEKPDETEEDDGNEEKQSAWKRLRDIAKERREEDQKKAETKSGPASKKQPKRS